MENCYERYQTRTAKTIGLKIFHRNITRS